MKTNIFLNVSLFVVAILTAAATYAQTTTVLNFDSIADGALTNQYQSLGVVAVSAPGSSVVVLPGSSTPWPSHSGAKLAYSPDGFMEFVLNPSIIGNVKTVSAYVSGVENTGIYAYDSSGNLLGQHLLGALPAPNTLLSVTSSTVPIARIAIHDGGAAFGIDDLTFVSAPTVPMCVAITQSLYNSVVALPLTVFKTAKTASTVKAAIAKLVQCFKASLNSDASNKVLLAQLAILKTTVDAALKASPQKTQIMNMINQLIAATKAGQC